MAGSTRGSARKSGSSGAGPEVPATRQTGPETATGQQIAWDEGEVDIPKGKERGSTVKVEEADPKGKPRGLQKEKALFVSNGQVAHDTVPSPTGLQPVGAVATSPEDAKKRVTQRVKEHEKYVNRTLSRNKPLDEATVGRLGRAELTAIGLQRGYEMPDAGTRATRAAFLEGQKADKTLDRSKK